LRRFLRGSCGGTAQRYGTANPVRYSKVNAAWYSECSTAQQMQDSTANAVERDEDCDFAERVHVPAVRRWRARGK
jgi:hypothetical protein